MVGVCLSVFSSCCFHGNLFGRVFSEIATFFLVLADRRATARTTTFVEPCSIQIKKRQRRANGRLVSFFLNALASLLFFSPPGVCLWSPDHTSKHVAGVLATVAASSILPYCCPSSSRNRSMLPIQSATAC